MGGSRGLGGDPELGELVARAPAADDFDVPDFPPVGQAPAPGHRDQRDGGGRSRPGYQPGAPGAEPATGQAEVSVPGLGDIPVPVTARTAAPGPGADVALPVTPPHGLIAIYTLLDDKVAEFDRAADEVAEQVRANEPDTLVYVIHTVPKAPMQRIFYEVYRDRAAYEWHEKQPYVQRFVTARRPFVLATNVIELRLKYAKVSPLPQAQAQAAQAQAALSQAQPLGAQAPAPAGTANLPAVRTGAGARSGTGRPAPGRRSPDRPGPDRGGADPRGRPGSRGDTGRGPAYSPRDPGYAPREPGYPPREPSYTPRDPGYPAPEPSYTPRDPGYPPPEPGYAPRDPGYAPGRPGYAPGDPGGSAREPAYPSREPGDPRRGRSPSRRRDAATPYQPDEPPATPRFGRI